MRESICFGDRGNELTERAYLAMRAVDTAKRVNEAKEWVAFNDTLERHNEIADAIPVTPITNRGLRQMLWYLQGRGLLDVLREGNKLVDCRRVYFRVSEQGQIAMNAARLRNHAVFQVSTAPVVTLNDLAADGSIAESRMPSGPSGGVVIMRHTFGEEDGKTP